MTTPRTPAEQEDDVLQYQPILSRNQKKRSKLQQAPDEPSVEEKKPDPVPESPPRTMPAPARRTRLKRSGQMHEDLTQPLPEDRPPRKEPEY